jgi:hypothetical protein
MTQTEESRPSSGTGTAPKTVGETATSLPRNADLLPWWDLADWMNDPALAYLKGLQDGAHLGREEHERDLVAALCEALGTEDLRSGINALIRSGDQVAARGGRGWVA